MGLGMSSHVIEGIYLLHSNFYLRVPQVYFVVW